MFDVSAKVYNALKADSSISTVCGGRIKHNGAPDGGIYPSIYYGEISNVPALHADNQEIRARSTIQVTVLSKTGDYGILPEAVEKVMLSLGFMRVSYNNLTDFRDGKLIYFKAMRFIIGGVSNG